MPQNLPEQILQRIVRLSADGNFQGDVARMLHRFGRRMSVRSIRRRLLDARYWSRRPARCLRLTLEHRRCRRKWGRRHRVSDLRQWRHCIFSDESRFSLYYSDGRVRVCRRQGERLIDACVQPNDGTSWYGVQSTMGGGVSWSWMEPWTGIVTSRSWWIKYCHGRRGCLDVTLCTSKTMPRPIQHVTRQPFWTNRMLRSWTGQLGVQTWTQLSIFGIKCKSGSHPSSRLPSIYWHNLHLCCIFSHYFVAYKCRNNTVNMIYTRSLWLFQNRA